MATIDLQSLCLQLLDPIREIGNWMREQQDQIREIETKSLNSLVSQVDIGAEKKLVALLKKALPEAGFLTEEETTEQAEADLRWIIDPLDGTTNYLHGLPHYAISVALESAGQVLIGLVYDCAKDEFFYAWQGGGAWLNGAKITVSQTASLKNALLSTGFPYYDFEQMAGYLKLLEYYMRHTRGLRRFGSAALDLAWVACGRYDGFFESGLNPWDVAGGILLIQEAGGKITDYSNGPTVILGKEILGSNGKLHNTMLENVATYLPTS